MKKSINCQSKMMQCSKFYLVKKVIKKTLSKKIKEDKYGVLDLKAKLNNNIDVDIKIQLNNYGNMLQRATFYSTRMVSTQLVVGDDYSLIKPVIVVAILDFDFFDFEEYVTKSVLVIDKYREYEIDTLQTYYYIELLKFRKSKIDTNDKVSGWLAFIDGKDERRIKIKKANEDLEVLSADKEIRELAEFRESSLREMASAKNFGIRRGKEERNIEIVKAMLKNNMSIEDIIEITGLSKEEVEKITK